MSEPIVTGTEEGSELDKWLVLSRQDALSILSNGELDDILTKIGPNEKVAFREAIGSLASSDSTGDLFLWLYQRFDGSDQSRDLILSVLGFFFGEFTHGFQRYLLDKKLEGGLSGDSFSLHREVSKGLVESVDWENENWPVDLLVDIKVHIGNRDKKVAKYTQSIIFDSLVKKTDVDMVNASRDKWFINLK